MLPDFKLPFHKQKMYCKCQRETPILACLHLPGAPGFFRYIFHGHCITVLVQLPGKRQPERLQQHMCPIQMCRPEAEDPGAAKCGFSWEFYTWFINYVLVWPCRPPLWGPNKWYHFNIITIIPSYLKGIDSNLKNLWIFLLYYMA